MGLTDLLEEDAKRWGETCAGMGRRQIMRVTGLGQERARRLAARLRQVPAAPAQNDAQNGPKASGVTIQRQPNGDLHVEAQGREGHPSSPLGQGPVRNLDELMAEAEIDPAAWTTDDFKVRTWPTAMRFRRTGSDGQRLDDEVVVVRNWYCAATFRRRLDRVTSPADWGARLERRERPNVTATRVAVVIPDIHVGYRWGRGHQALHPLHDWAAIDAVFQLVHVVRPDVVQVLGDLLDNAAFSTKFPVALELRDTVRPSLLTGHAILRQIRIDCPSAEIDYQGGNHESRGERGAVGTEFDGLTPADDVDGAPLLSFARMLGLDALDISWRNYGEHRWLFERILVEHGSKVKSRGGLTVAEIIRDAQTSVLFGHIHRAEMASRTIHGPAGRRVITACSPGTLARIDGTVPGVSNRPDWQQGVALVSFDGGQEHIELVPIHDGVLYWRGERFEGDGDRLADEVAKQIRYPQIAST